MDSGQNSHFCSVYCGSERFHYVDDLVDRWTMNVERLTLNDERWTMNDERWTMNVERWTINVERWTMNDERWTMNVERLTLNDERWTINDERWTMNEEPLLNPPLKGRTFVRWVKSVERWKSSTFIPDKITLLFTCSLVHLFTHLLCINNFLICYFSYNIYYIYIIAQIHKCVNSEQWTSELRRILT